MSIRMVEKILIQNAKLIRILMLPVCFSILFFPIRQTASLLTTYWEIREQLRNADDYPVQAEVKYPMDIFENVDLNRTLFDAIGESAKQHNVIIKQINPPVRFQEDQFLLLTEEITLQGDFISMLKCIDMAETNLGPIKI